MRRKLGQTDGADPRRHRLQRLPLRRRAGIFADVSMMIEDHENDRLLAGDDHVEHPGASWQCF
jgi:hypothetical protein